MNNQRRKRIREAIDRLTDISTDVSELASEEEEYRDNIPENLQGSDRYEVADAAATNLTDASSGIDDVVAYLEAALE